jgi:hypothetical protein
MNFRELIDREAAGDDPTERPTLYRVMAERCGISRAYLYFLFDGLYEPKPWTVARIAKGLDVDEATVREALAESRAAAKT